MVPKPFQQWSLLIEVSESKHHPVPRSRAKLRALVKEGLVKSGMLPEGAKVVAMWDKRLEYGYPVPYVERNMHVHEADRALRSLGIWSRGRFGSWKYEVGNQDHSCFLGIDAVDSMLFGGSAAGREATFNVPNKVNVQYRKYDFDFDPAALARDAGRHHRFGKPPRRLQRLPQWDWVAHRCKEHDVWTDAVRKVMVALPRPTKWLIHSYEGCGAAEIKRPMPEMLREGLNHLDRIPFDSALPQIAAWLRCARTRARERKREREPQGFTPQSRTPTTPARTPLQAHRRPLRKAAAGGGVCAAQRAGRLAATRRRRPVRRPGRGQGLWRVGQAPDRHASLDARRLLRKAVAAGAARTPLESAVPGAGGWDGADGDRRLLRLGADGSRGAAHRLAGAAGGGVGQVDGCGDGDDALVLDAHLLRGEGDAQARPRALAPELRCRRSGRGWKWRQDAVPQGAAGRWCRSAPLSSCVAGTLADCAHRACGVAASYGEESGESVSVRRRGVFIVASAGGVGLSSTRARDTSGVYLESGGSSSGQRAQRLVGWV